MPDSHFSINNIPFGIGSRTPNGQKSVVTRLRDKVIFLEKVVKAALLPTLPSEMTSTFSQSTLNALAALPQQTHISLRTALQTLLSSPYTLPSTCTAPVSDVTFHLPFSTRNFTDFSCSNAHLLNAGEAMRKTKAPLPPNVSLFPIGYTARSASLIASGTGVVRPKGQFKYGGSVIYAPTRQLDYELEVAAVVGEGTSMGETVESGKAGKHIFGLVLLNDWSARDIQAMEMQPFGPMNGKSFASTLSPWVITTLALEPFTCPALFRPTLSASASYLIDTDPNNTYDIHLSALLRTSRNSNPITICKSELKSMNWTLRDLVAQATANGCPIETGDLLATGTISGFGDEEHGCLLELNRGGEKEIGLEGGERRMWLEDGDCLTLSAWAGEGVGFGECVGTVLPAW